MFWSSEWLTGAESTDTEDEGIELSRNGNASIYTNRLKSVAAKWQQEKSAKKAY